MKKEMSVMKAAGILMIAMISSRILGYLRDVIIYAQFGQNRMTDAYNAAFSIPDFLYMILVGGALSSAFIPTFSSYIAKEEEDEGWHVASITFSIVFIGLLIGVAVGMIFTPQLVRLLVPGFEKDAMDLTIFLTRIMFLQVIFMVMAGLSMGVLNSYKKFVAPAVGSVAYNLGIIVFGVALGYWIEKIWPGYGIAGFSIGVVLGAAINFLIQVPALLKIGLRYKPSLDVFHPGFLALFKLIVPVFIGLSVSQINLFVIQNLASDLPGGMIAAIKTGQRLMQLPIGVFAIAIAVAIFPTLTGYAAKKEFVDFKNAFSLGLRSVFFITLPATAVLMVLRIPIIRFMYEYERGKFTPQATLVTSEALYYFAIGIFAYSAIHVLSRAFYALKDTKTPVIIASFSVIINIVLSILLIKTMQHKGLALAYSLSGIINMVVLVYYLRKKIGQIDLKKIFVSFFQTMVSTGALALAMYSVLGFWENYWGHVGKLNQFLELIVALGVGGIVFVFLSFLFKMEEMEMVKAMVRKKFGKRAA